MGGVDAPHARGGPPGLVHQLEAEEIARHVRRKLARGRGRGERAKPTVPRREGGVDGSRTARGMVALET